ncbi:MAG: hypothetical protein RLZZ04_229 [Cyanobacteriota bacterium]|jgi:MGT family glycosyltransferase
MTHFGILSSPLTGHLNPILSVAYELKKRGHHISVFGILDLENKVKLTGDLDFYPIGKEKYPQGTQTKIFARQGKSIGLSGVRNIFKILHKFTELNLEEAIAAIKTSNVDTLIIDQALIEGETIASFLNLPFITVCGCILLNSDPQLPSFYTSLTYDPSWFGRLRNKIVNKYITLATISTFMSLIETIVQFRKEHHFENEFNLDSIWSKKAVICQQPREFDFPRILPEQYHYVGPLISKDARPQIDFPWEKLNGKPLIYASLGTLQNQLISLYQMIADACTEFDVQLVIALGNPSLPLKLEDLPGSPLVVQYAPQLELLKKATLCITHAGLNTSMECLMNAVPMVAIPITNDQPGVGARIAWTGTGEVIPVRKVSVKKLKTAIKRVLSDNSYRKNALKLKETTIRAGGVTKAADIIEQVVTTGKPVLATTQQ